MRTLRKMLAFACALAPLTLVAQTTLHVPADYATIQAAINASVAGDIVEVAPGTYFENINFSGRAITLRSSAGPATTIIDGGHAGPVVTFESGESLASVLQGFTIRNGVNSDGAGVSLFAASATIVDNVFEFNEQTAGGSGAGVGGNGSSPNVQRNLFRSNSCDTQAGSAVVVMANTSAPRIANNVFDGNPCPAIRAGASTAVVNNTIVRNRIGLIISAAGDMSSAVYRNNIIYWNETGVSYTQSAPSSGLQLRNNIVFDNTTDYLNMASQTGSNGNLAVDPALGGLFDGDYRLDAASPAIDAGGNSVVLPLEKDFYGQSRVIAGQEGASAIVDIGAVEFAPTPDPPAVSLVASPDEIAIGETVTLTWVSTDATSCDAFNAWAGDLAPTGSLTLTPTSAGVYTYAISCDGPGGSATASATVGVIRRFVVGGGGSLPGGTLLALLGLAALRVRAGRTR